MRVFSICRKCAEVHLAELECPGCAIGTLPAPQRILLRSRRAPDEPAAPSFAADSSLARRGMIRASTLVVSAYVFAVVVLLLAVFAQA